MVRFFLLRKMKKKNVLNKNLYEIVVEVLQPKINNIKMSYLKNTVRKKD